MFIIHFLGLTISGGSDSKVQSDICISSVHPNTAAASTDIKVSSILIYSTYVFCKLSYFLIGSYSAGPYWLYFKEGPAC